MKINKQKKKNFKAIGLAVGALILIGGGVAAYMIINNQNKADSQNSSEINYDPPTEEEVQEGQNAKKDAYEESGSTPSDAKNTTSKKQVNVGVSYADIYDGNLEIRAFT